SRTDPASAHDPHGQRPRADHCRGTPAFRIGTCRRRPAFTFELVKAKVRIMRQTVIGLAAALVLTAGPALAQENDLRTTPSGVSEAAAATETGTDASTAESADTAGTGDVSGSGETIPPENTVDVEEGLNRDDDSVERDRGDSSILPNAEGHLESEAETM